MTPGEQWRLKQLRRNSGVTALCRFMVLAGALALLLWAVWAGVLP